MKWYEIQALATMTTMEKFILLCASKNGLLPRKTAFQSYRQNLYFFLLFSSLFFLISPFIFTLSHISFLFGVCLSRKWIAEKIYLMLELSSKTRSVSMVIKCAMLSRWSTWLMPWDLMCKKHEKKIIADTSHIFFLRFLSTLSFIFSLFRIKIYFRMFFFSFSPTLIAANEILLYSKQWPIRWIAV